MFTIAGPALDYCRAGTLHALAVTTAAHLAALPEIPSVGEFVPGYEASGWFGLAAPKDTAIGIVETLNREINAALADSTTKARLAGLVVAGSPGSPADFARLIVADTRKWADVVHSAHITVG